MADRYASVSMTLSDP